MDGIPRYIVRQVDPFETEPRDSIIAIMSHDSDAELLSEALKVRYPPLEFPVTRVEFAHEDWVKYQAAIAAAVEIGLDTERD